MRTKSARFTTQTEVALTDEQQTQNWEQCRPARSPKEHMKGNNDDHYHRVQRCRQSHYRYILHIHTCVLIPFLSSVGLRACVAAGLSTSAVLANLVLSAHDGFFILLWRLVTCGVPLTRPSADHTFPANCHHQWWRKELSIGGYSPGVPRWDPEAKPMQVGDLFVPRSWNTLQTLFTDFDCRDDQNLKISHNSLLDSWPVCFTMGLWHIGGA